jgi:eukaryotic-like serine/threonine-protein kinase
MRWNPFRRPVTADAADSSFESTMVDEAAMTRLSGNVGEALQAARAATAATAASTDSIGHVGRYALKTVLGKGGLGTVYAAWDPLLSRSVALKTLHVDTDPATRGSFDALFLNEARAAAGLSHPHIVTVFDAGPSDMGVYIAMERLQGQDLRHMLLQGARPGPVEAAQIVRRVADALAYAHRKGVVHCDVKPANIFMVGRLHPKVLDFGIARVAHRDGPAPHDGFTAGSPYYLAPEQIDGRSVDRRSDVYSLGVVLYELLTGKRPFDGRSLEEIAQAVRTAEVVPPHRVAPKVPPGLSTIALRAMARDPEQRFPSARDLAMELRHWLDSAEARTLRDEPQPAAARRSALASLGVPLVVAGAAGAIWWARSTTGPDVHPVAAAPASAASATLASAASAAARPASAASRAIVAANTLSLDTSAGAAGLAASAAASAPRAASAVVAVANAEAASRAQARADARKRRAGASAASVVTAAANAEGLVQLAVTPWGQVEVDGHAMGISPPLTRVLLPAGPHVFTVRNADFPAYTVTLSLSGDNPVTLRHRFGP